MAKKCCESKPRCKDCPKRKKKTKAAAWFVDTSKCLAIASCLHLYTTLAAGATLEVVVDGVRDYQGQVRAALYNGPDGFPKDGRALVVESAPATPGSTTLRFKDLPPGRYAVIAYQDEDNNAQLNKRFGMIPTEGYGLSNNPQVFGKPGFDVCSFEFNRDQLIKIQLKY